jgi:hypothetical protein
MGYRKDNQYRNYNKRDHDYKTRKPDTKGASPSHVTITPKNNEKVASKGRKVKDVL